MKTAIYNQLNDDATLMAILTGGLHHQIIEITRQDAAAAFDANGEIKPCALMKLSTDAPTGPHYHGARLFFNIYFYQRAAYDQIKLAMDRTYALLHRQKLTPVDGSTCWQINHDSNLPEEEDQALRCAMGMSRYAAYIGRS